MDEFEIDEETKRKIIEQMHENVSRFYHQQKEMERLLDSSKLTEALKELVEYSKLNPNDYEGIQARAAKLRIASADLIERVIKFIDKMTKEGM